MVCTVDTNQPAPSRRTGGRIRRSQSIKWGWSLSDPALCDSRLGCPAIYPNFLMTYEIIRLDRRPSWSGCGLRKCSPRVLCGAVSSAARGKRHGWDIFWLQSTACDAVLSSRRLVPSYTETATVSPQPKASSTIQQPRRQGQILGTMLSEWSWPAFQVGNAPHPFPLHGAPQTPPSLPTLPRVSLCQSEMLAIPPPPPSASLHLPRTTPGYSYDQPAETPHSTRSHRH